MEDEEYLISVGDTGMAPTETDTGPHVWTTRCMDLISQSLISELQDVSSFCRYLLMLKLFEFPVILFLLRYLWFTPYIDILALIDTC